MKAVEGATLTCTGRRTDGTTIDIPVRVLEASESRVTWEFDRR